MRKRLAPHPHVFLNQTNNTKSHRPLNKTIIGLGNHQVLMATNITIPPEMNPATEEYRNRRRSFGRGGAGNIRSHAEATVVNFTDGSEGHPRRSSVWSTTSTASTSSTRRSKLFGSVKNLFSRSPDQKEIEEEET